jgi:hypothetical protein
MSVLVHVSRSVKRVMADRTEGRHLLNILRYSEAEDIRSVLHISLLKAESAEELEQQLH